MQKFIATLRTLVFYVCYATLTTVFSLSALLFIWFFPFKLKFRYISFWNVAVLFLIKVILRIDYKITGLENLPKNKPYIALSNHQSQLETFLLLLLLRPVSIILKKELLSIPGFGWGLRMLKPIAIDRSNPKQALKQIQKVGLSRLQDDKIPLLIFPEGTRVAVDGIAKYARSGAALALATDCPIIFIAHNAGYFWPSDEFHKTPGTLEVIISEPQDIQGKSSKQITDEAEIWIRANVRPPKFR